MDKLYTMKWDYRFTFGKYRAIKVEDVFSNGWYGKSYIVWAYYMKEDITFTDDILDALDLPAKIAKPGTAPEKYREWIDTLPADVKEMLETYHKHCAMGRASHRKSVYRKYCRDRLAKHEDAMERASSKARLQWKNQGH